MEPRSLDFQLGRFALAFEGGGKLRRLVLPNGVRPLHESDYPFDLGHGRVFHPGGWDECFPTIDPHGDSPVMGELIAAAPALARRGGEIRQTWSLPRYTARRTFRLVSGSQLEAAFSAENTSGRPLDFLWASHALFSTQGLLQAVLSDGGVLADFSANGQCGKFFLAAAQPVVLRRTDGQVRLHTDQPLWGVWLNRGGWPADRGPKRDQARLQTSAPAGFCCLGIEATNAAAETPAGAKLAPGESFRGKVIVEAM